MDRKAWIVLITCSILLAFNIHLQSQNNAAQRAAEAAEAATQTPDAVDPPVAAAPAETPSLEVKREPIGSDATHKIETGTNIFELSSLEGGIKEATIKDELTVKDLNQKIRINDLGRSRIGALVSGSGDTLDVPFYKIQSQDADSIVYIGTLTNGLGVKKTWTKVNDGGGADYRIKLTLDLYNTTEVPTSLGSINLVTGSSAPLHKGERPNYLNFFWQEEGDYNRKDQNYFKGGFFSSEKLSFSEELAEGIDYAGVENQFFATIVDPADTYRSTFRAQPTVIDLPADRGGESANLLTTSISLPDENLAPKASKTLVFDIFMGPKNNFLIRSLEGEKDKVMNYGWFGWISCPLNWILNKFSNLFGGENNPWSWGWAIMALTILIRSLMWPLHAKSTRTMKRMSKLQPKMAELKEKYPDDPNKMNQEMMKLYRTYGVNPMGGCLPMLAQIPIFFGFFTMLQYAVELRNQPFLGWVKDLSQPDTVAVLDLPFSLPFLGTQLPLNILPVLMAITMILQMKMTPKTGDKMQQRIMMFMPIIFFFFCYNFASALALYWTTQNIFSIGQTWLMQKMPEAELKESNKPAKKSMMQKLAERAEEAQKTQKARKKAGAQGGQQAEKPKKPRGPKTGG
ncbi:MAG: membrane protein insertase YidC [Verrucomicrobiaceae bacterium]